MKKTVSFLVLLLSLMSLHASAPESIGNNSGYSANSLGTFNAVELSEKLQQHTESHAEKPINKEEVALDEFDNLHPLVVHFPIVLLLFAALLQGIQLFVLKRNLDWVILFQDKVR